MNAIPFFCPKQKQVADQRIRQGRKFFFWSNLTNALWIKQDPFVITAFLLLAPLLLRGAELTVSNSQSSSINLTNIDKVTITSGGHLTINSNVFKSGNMQEFKVEGRLTVNAGFSLTWPGPMSFVGDVGNHTIDGSIIQSNGAFKVDKRNIVGSGSIVINDGPLDLSSGRTILGCSSNCCSSFPCTLPSVSNTITTGSVSPTSFCAGATISVPFTATGFSGNRTFTAQLSNGSGLFTSAVNIGTTTINTSQLNGGTISATIPANQSAGTGYRIRVIQESTIGSLNSNGDLTVLNTTPAQPSTISGPANPCQGATGLSYSVTLVSGVTYTWVVPSGWLITSGQNTNSITVTAGSSSGSISVTPSNACGNGTARSRAVAPNTPPSFTTCPGNITTTAGSPTCTAQVNYLVSASGTPAPPLTYSITGATTVSGNGAGSGTTFNLGVSTVTITASNICSPDATCSFTVTVNDNQSPTVGVLPATRTILNTCNPANITNPPYSTIAASSTYSEFSNATNQGTASDNCGITSVTYQDSETGACPNTITRTWTLRDAANNTVTSNQTINLIPAQLPITLTSFQASPEEEGIALSWSTATEIDNDYMAIERSVDGRDFDEIGRVAGQGTVFEPQSYTFFDRFPNQGLNYYRLRQVDFDGSFEYHPVISVDYRGKGQLDLQLAPNPVGEELQINWHAPVANQNGTLLRVLDLNGRLLAQYALNGAGGAYRVPVTELPAGLYLVQISQGAQQKVLRFAKK